MVNVTCDDTLSKLGNLSTSCASCNNAKKILPRTAKRCHEYLGDLSEVNMFMCNFLILQLGASGIYPL